MVRTEGTQTRLLLLAAALVLALLALGLVGTATASGPDTPEQEIVLRPTKGKFLEPIRPDRFHSRLCPHGFRSCRYANPSVEQPTTSLSTVMSTAVEPDGLTSDVQFVTGKVSKGSSIIRCPDRLCPLGDSSCNCGRPSEN